jgi:hypothetical protein
MLKTRLEKTFDKLHAGELPEPPAIRTLMDSNRETRCSGCGDMIGMYERYYHARIRRVITVRFHLACHEAWVRFRRQPANAQSPRVGLSTEKTDAPST